MNKFFFAALLGLSSLFAYNTRSNADLTVDLTFGAADSRSGAIMTQSLTEHQDFSFLEAEGTTRSGKSFKALILDPTNSSWSGLKARAQVKAVNVGGVRVLVGTVTSSSEPLGASRTCPNCPTAGIILTAKHNTLSSPKNASNLKLKDLMISSVVRPVGSSQFVQMNVFDSTPFVAGIGTLDRSNTTSSAVLTSANGITTTSSSLLNGQVQTLNTNIGLVGLLKGTDTSLDGSARGINAILIGL